MYGVKCGGKVEVEVEGGHQHIAGKLLNVEVSTHRLHAVE